MQEPSSLHAGSLRKALQSLIGVLEAPQPSGSFDRLVFQDSIIQRFEYTYELSWKLIKRALEALGNEDLDAVGRRDLFRMAAEAKLIDDSDQWFEYCKARNRTSHAYDQEVADAVLDVVRPFAKDAGKLLAELEVRVKRGE